MRTYSPICDFEPHTCGLPSSVLRCLVLVVFFSLTGCHLVEFSFDDTAGTSGLKSRRLSGERAKIFEERDLPLMNFSEPGWWNDLGPGSRRWGLYYGIVEVSGED